MDPAPINLLPFGLPPPTCTDSRGGKDKDGDRSAPTQSFRTSVCVTSPLSVIPLTTFMVHIHMCVSHSQCHSGIFLQNKEQNSRREQPPTPAVTPPPVTASVTRMEDV